MKVESYLGRHLGQIEILRHIAYIKPVDVALEAGPEERPVGKLNLFQKKLLTLIWYKIYYGDLEERASEAAFLLMILQRVVGEKYPVDASQKLVIRKGFKVCVRPVSWGIPIPFVIFQGPPIEEQRSPQDQSTEESQPMNWTLN